MTAASLTFLRHSFKAMGSPCELQLFAATEADARRVADLAATEIERLEALYSRYRDDSLLSRINRVAADGGEIAVDAETAGLLNYAAACHEQSGGLFDVTSGILRAAWRFDGEALPDRRLIETLLARVGWHRLRWTPPLLSFPEPGLELDLGGVVKEYAADRAAAVCREQGIVHGVVNLGGDVRIIGPRADGSAWRIGIRHPRDRAGTVKSLLLREGALATSGDYERCIVVNGIRYGHILNPRTGWPVRRMAAVSVVADLCVVAGSASTIAMLKEDEGPEWLRKLGLPHLWIDTEGRSGGTLM